MSDWFLGNTFVAGLAALTVFAVCRRLRARPALCHVLWLLVFVVLVAPPLPLTATPGVALRDGLGALLETGPAVPEVEPALLETATPLPDLFADGAADAGLAAGPPAAAPRPREPGLFDGLAAVSTSTWLLLAWGAGSLLVLGWQWARIRSFHDRVRRAKPAPVALDVAVAEVAKRLGVPAPEVRVLAGVGSPSVWCFGRPRLLWPAGDDGRPQPADPVLIAHELAHLARRDHWVARLEALAVVALWWHPLLWVVRRQVNDYSELACDAWALWAFPDERRAYAVALIDAQERTITAPMALQGLCATGKDVKDFERRLKMIMKRNVSRRVPRRAAAAACLATLLVLPGFGPGDETMKRKPAHDGPELVADLVAGHKLSKQAEQAFQDGRHEEAAGLFLEAVALDPSDGHAHSRLGYLTIGSGDHDAALQHLQRQLELGFRPAVAAYNLACVHSLTGRPDASLAWLDHAIQLGFRDLELLTTDPDLEAVRAGAGFPDRVEAARTSKELHTKLEGAEGWFSDEGELSALRIELAGILTRDGELQHQAGLALLPEGRHAEAATAFARQAEAGYAVANAHYNLACAHALMGDTEAALAALTRSAELGMVHPPIGEDADLVALHGDPRFDALAQRIGEGKADKKKLKKALEKGDAAAAKDLFASIAGDTVSDEEAAWAAYEMGKVLLADGEAATALVHFTDAVRYGEQPQRAVFGMAEAYAVLGQDDQALLHLDHAVTLGFADPKAVAKLLKTHQLGDEATRDELVATAKRTASEKEAYGKKKKMKMKEEGKQKPKADKATAKAG